MTYRQPAFMVNHPMSALDIAEITSLSGGLTDAELRSLIDFRVSEYAVFGSSAFQQVRIDFQAGVAYNRCVIPSGHNLDTRTVNVYTDADVAYGSPALAGTSGVISGDGVIDIDLTPATERYWAVNLETPATVAPEISEIWIGDYNQLTDAAVDTRFDNGYESQLTQVEYPSGLATLQLAPARRTFSLTVTNVDPAGADYTVLDAVAQTGRAAPFWYWPPDTVDAGPFLVQLTRDARRRQEFPAPLAAIRYEIELEMVEQRL